MISLKNTLSTWLLFITTLLAAQGSISQVYSFGTQAYFYDAVYADQQEQVMAGGGILHPDSFLIGAVLARLDTAGILVDTSLYFDPDGHHLSFKQAYPMHQNTDNRVMMMGDYLGKQANIILLWNADGTLHDIWDLPYAPDTQNNFIHAIVELPSGYLLAQSRQSGFIARTVITKLDHTGTVVWERTFGPSNKFQVPNCLIRTGSNSFVIGGYRAGIEMPGTNVDVSCEHNLLIGIDSMGNQLWEWRNPDCNISSLYGLQQAANGDYIYITHEPLVYNLSNIGRAPKVVRRDSAFNLVWERRLADSYTVGYNSNAFYTMRLLPDGDLLTAGHLILPEPYSSFLSTEDGYYTGCFYRLRANGDSLYRTTIRTPEAYRPTSKVDLGGLVALPSGAHIGVGKFSDPFTGGYGTIAWFLKIDANGCFEADCQLVNATPEPSATAPVRVFPNPTDGETIFSFERPSTGTLRLFSSTGRLVATHKLVNARSWTTDLSHLSKGVYHYAFTDQYSGVVLSGRVVLQR